MSTVSLHSTLPGVYPRTLYVAAGAAMMTGEKVATQCV